MEKIRCFPQELLKLIACITMLIDHIGAVFFPHLLWFRVIGRIAFPIYCFLLAEGMHHTGDPLRYLLRLFIGIFLAELPFDFLFFGGLTWSHQSVMVTLTLGGFMLLCMNKASHKALKLLLIIPFTLVSEACMCDYGGYGILLIAIFALTEKRLYRLPLVLMLGLINDAQHIVDSLQHFSDWPTNVAVKHIICLRPPIQSYSVVAMAPIGLYSGRKLTPSRAIQTGFYLFYPVHLAVLAILANYLL